MPAGRPPTPTALLKLRGTYRKDRHGRRGGEPQPEKPATVPKAPAFLDAIGKREWRRVAPQLHAVGCLTALDVAALAGYCATYAQAIAAERALKDQGLTYRTAQGLDIPRPEVAIAKSAWAEMRKFAQEFGMTPSSRTRVNTPDNPEARRDAAWDEFTEFLSRGAPARDITG